MNRINAEVMTQIERLCRDGGVTLDQPADMLKEIKEKKEYERVIESMEDGKRLVGRCFKGRNLEGVIAGNGVKPVLGKEMIFYKVVSERAGRVGEVECITFSQIPVISFRAETHLLWQPSDGIVGHYCYSGIHNHSVSKHAIEALQEISLEEFESAARDHLEQLLKTNWQSIATPYVTRGFDNE